MLHWYLNKSEFWLWFQCKIFVSRFGFDVKNKFYCRLATLCRKKALWWVEMAMGLVIANRSALFQYSVIIIVNNWYCTNATQNLVDDIGSSFCNLHFSVHRRWRTDPLRQQQLQKNTPQIRSQEIWIRRSIIVIFLIWGILKWTIPVLFFVNFNFFLKRTICPSSNGWWDSNPRPLERESPPKPRDRGILFRLHFGISFWIKARQCD